MLDEFIVFGNQIFCPCFDYYQKQYLDIYDFIYRLRKYEIFIKYLIHLYWDRILLRDSVNYMVNWYTLSTTNNLIQIWFQVRKKNSLKINKRHADNMALIPYPIQNHMKQCCIVRRNVGTFLNAALIIGGEIQVIEPIGYGHL